MACILSLLLALALVATATLGAAREEVTAKVTPVQKVIGLLNNMVEKGKEEKNAEQVQFVAFEQFCKSTIVEKQEAIKKGAEMIDMFKADMQKQGSEAEMMAKEVAKHDEEISTWEGDFKAATKVREIEAADYIKTHKDYTESINALEDGIATMKKRDHKTKQASASLMQLASATFFPTQGRRAIESFLAKDPDENLAVAAPEADAYDFQSEGLIDMLDKLKAKFEDERAALEKMEANAVNSFAMLSQDLRAQIETGTNARTEKSVAKGKALQAQADAKSDLIDTSETKDEDTKYLADLTAQCASKKAAFGDRQKLREEEIKAVEKAIDILSSGAVSGAADEHLPALAQVKAKTSLTQLRSALAVPAQLRVAAYLKDRAGRINSRLLSALATQVSADPFKKVKKMIKDLIVKLMEEANEEAEHKGWCDTELSTNEQTRKEKTEKVEMLTAEIDELDASIAKLTEDIQTLTKAVAELDAAIAKATGIRAEEKAKNADTIKDAQAAQTAVAQALSVLKDFYEKAGEATALLQQRQAQMPEVFSDEPYKGMGAENGGVVGMIEVIQSDFARLEADTGAAEAEAQKEYDEFMTDSSMDKAQKSADIEHKTSKQQNQGQALQEKKGDLAGTQKELDAAMTYYEKLKPSCVDSGVSYEDRVARRKEEIESLQEALRILNGEDIALLELK